MVSSFNKLKNNFTENEILFSEEFTANNYNNKGKLIKEKIPTLTTKYCEIGFYKNIIYFVFIVHSKSWNKSFYDYIKKRKEAKLYGLKNFKKDFDLSVNPVKEIKDERFFQIQLVFKDIEEKSLFDLYNTNIKDLNNFKLSIFNQLNH